MAKLLMAEDDREFSERFSELMKPHGWMVEVAITGDDALQLLRTFQYDFILLDWNLPGCEGIEICRQFRTAGGDTPIIFLTSRDAIVDKEAGLDAGGDDYMTKPVDVRELLARMRSVRRRDSRGIRQSLEIKGVQLDPQLRKATYQSKDVQLSLSESNILEYLLRNPNKYFSAGQLFEAIWPSDAEASEHTVRVHLGVLRRKLALIGADSLINTVRGSGYIIEDR